MIGNKKHFLVAGATGLVGSTLVEMLLSNETVGKVTVLVRRATSFESEKLEERMIDFDSFTEREIAPSVDAIFCCLGTTMAQAGGKDAFRRVDYEYPVKLAVFAQRQNIQQFHVISSSGASPTSKIFYSKVKGRMELEIKKLDKIRSIYISLIPSHLIDPSKKKNERLSHTRLGQAPPPPMPSLCVTGALSQIGRCDAAPGVTLCYCIFRPRQLHDTRRPPLVVLHGGPSIPSNYLLPIVNGVTDRTVIFYDQFGCGKSSRPSNASTCRPTA